MNGEIQQASNIVISARKSLYENKEIDFTPSKHVLSIQFVFAPRLFGRQITANSVCEWFNICLQRGLKDIKFVIPSNKANRHLLGFANTSQCAIICFWEKGSISRFYPTWNFDREKAVWRVRYTEQYINKNTIIESLHFSDRTDEFRKTLFDIGKFAKEIEQPFFRIFFIVHMRLCAMLRILTTQTSPNNFPSI